MAAIKSYTDISQSKTLSKILPLESADMYWDYDVQKHEYYPMIMDDQFDDTCTCAWSLAALLSVLLEYHLSSPNPLSSMHCCRVNDIETYANNPVDACYEMILKLHELNLL